MTDDIALMPKGIKFALLMPVDSISARDNYRHISANDGGHPALPAVDRETAFVQFQLFASYREWVQQLIAALPFL